MVRGADHTRLIADFDAAYLLMMYSKNETPTPSAEDKATLKNFMKAMKSPPAG